MPAANEVISEERMLDSHYGRIHILQCRADIVKFASDFPQ